jgi:hypothetical protein
MSVRVRRNALRAGLAIVVAAALLAVAVWYLPSASIQPGRSVSWKLGYVGGHAFDASAASDAMIVPIEVYHPYCVPTAGGPWFDVTVSYTPSSVTIQARMTAAAAAQCPAPAPQPAGSLAIVGEYLSGVPYTVKLREPLGGRALFDGFTFPAAARPYQ